MYRQSPSRNQRTKGFKVKHTLQICLLLAVCIWLLYQVKHSHDKKKEFESKARMSEKVESGHEIIKFGRKDLNPLLEESALENQRQNDEETEEEEENKAEEEDESKPEETEEEGRGGGDDEIDEHDQERVVEDIEHVEDSTDEEESDREEKENEKGGQSDDNGLSDDQDQDHDGRDRTTQEAREENYKGDDASSAVVRDSQEIEDSRGSNMEEQVENAGKNDPEQENTSHSTGEVTANENDSGSKMGEGEEVVANPSANATATEEKMGEKVESNLSANATATEERGTEGTLAESEDGSTSNSTLIRESNSQIDASGSSSADNAKTHDSSLQNGTEAIADPTQHQNLSEGSGRPTGGDNHLQTVVLEQIKSNTTDQEDKSETNTNVALNTENSDVTSGEPTDASGNSSSVVPELQAIKANVTAGVEDGSSSLTTNENAEMLQSEKADKTTGMEENKDGSTSSMTNDKGQATAIQHDPIDSSDSSILREMKEAQTGLGTLLETNTEGTDHDGVTTE